MNEIQSWQFYDFLYRNEGEKACINFVGIILIVFRIEIPSPARLTKAKTGQGTCPSVPKKIAILVQDDYF
jgi:hypothetical protein